MNRCTTCGAERMHGLCHPGVAKPASTYDILSLVFKASAPRDPRSAFPPHYDLAVSDMDRNWQFADGERDSAPGASGVIARLRRAVQIRRMSFATVCGSPNQNATGGAGGEARRGSQSQNRQQRLLAWLDLHRAVEHKEDVSQLDVICIWLGSTDRLLNGRQKSTTMSCRTTTLSKRAPKEVLLAVLEAHELLAGPTCDALTIEWTKFCRQCFLESARANCLKRRSIRGGRGGGVVSNKANITARHSDLSPWDFASGMTLQEMKRQHH